MNALTFSKKLINASTLNELESAIEYIAENMKFYNVLFENNTLIKSEVYEAVKLATQNPYSFYFEVIIYMASLISALLFDYERTNDEEKRGAIIEYCLMLKYIIEYSHTILNINSNINLKG